MDSVRLWVHNKILIIISMFPLKYRAYVRFLLVKYYDGLVPQV